MSTQAPFTRRLAIAIGTASASATIAVGVTAASLLGWFSPRADSAPPEPSVPATTPAPSPVILVPVSPTTPPSAASGDVQLAMDERQRDVHEDDEHDRDHDDEEGDDDD